MSYNINTLTINWSVFFSQRLLLKKLSLFITSDSYLAFKVNIRLGIAYVHVGVSLFCRFKDIILNDFYDLDHEAAKFVGLKME